MCGIYFSNSPNAEIDNRFLLRGPDYFNKINFNNFTMCHSLLSLTGEFTPQPVEKNGVRLIFNGQIYNYDNNLYSSDSYFILDKYLKKGINFWKELDGEYAILIYDSNKNLVYFLTDIFGTKPLFYSIDNGLLSVSSLQTTLKKNNSQNIVKCKPNTIYSYDLTSQNFTIFESYFKFNLDQYKNSFDRWNELFIDSIKKRFKDLKHGIVLPLSSGHDSGAISCAFDILGIPYFTYSFFRQEHQKVLLKRLLRRFISSPRNTRFRNNLQNEEIRKRLIQHIQVNGDSFFYGKNIDNLSQVGSDDPGAIGLAYVLDKAKKHDSNIKIVASGQGGDEIYSNRQQYTFDKPNPKIFDNNLSKIFPWQNFFYGTQMSYISKEESVGGSFGLETRYPFLDKNLVQEYLNLSPNLKNQNYKAPITNFLKLHNYPYRLDASKSGFNP